MSSVKLYTSWFCPFSQRTWIALLYKGMDFEYIEQDPYDKNPAWLAVNPNGFVPTIIHNGKAIYESYVCMEYIDDTWTDTNLLLPKEPYERAQARIWSNHVTNKIVPPFYEILLKTTQEERDMARTELLEQIAVLTAAMDHEGPFFMGGEFGVVDMMFFPFAVRFEHVLEGYRNFSIPREPRFERYFEWFEAVEILDCVKVTIAPRDKLMEFYQKYSDNTAVSEVATAVRKGTTLP